MQRDVNTQELTNPDRGCLLAVSGEGQLGVQCWACPYMKFVNVTCKAHERYISEIPVTDTFCSGVANSPPLSTYSQRFHRAVLAVSAWPRLTVFEKRC